MDNLISNQTIDLKWYFSFALCDNLQVKNLQVKKTLICHTGNLSFVNKNTSNLCLYFLKLYFKLVKKGVPFLKIAHTMHFHNLIKNLFDFALVRLK